MTFTLLGPKLSGVSPTPEPTVAVHLATATGARPLPEPYERALVQRLTSIAEYMRSAPIWRDWSRYIGGTLITIYLVDDDAKPSEVTRYDETWRLDLRMLIGDFRVLPPDPATTLRLVNAIEVALTQCREQFFHGMPNYIGRTPQEIQWLAVGGTDPGPGTPTALLARRPPPRRSSLQGRNPPD